MHETVLKLLSARKGHFLLESGHHGDLWLDLESLCLHPRRVQAVAAELPKPLSILKCPPSAAARRSASDGAPRYRTGARPYRRQLRQEYEAASSHVLLWDHSMENRAIFLQGEVG